MGLIKQTGRSFQEHEFSVSRRYECLVNLPEVKRGRNYKVGDIWESKNEDIVIGEDFYQQERLFKKLEWYERRTFEQLFSIKYIQVSIQDGYYLLGDLLEVDAYKISNDKNPLFVGFTVGNHTILRHNCLPLDDYKMYKYRNVKRIHLANV